MKFLRKKGVLQREDVGGAIGVRWTAAVRTGQSFPADLCELFLASGQLETVDGRSDVFMACLNEGQAITSSKIVDDFRQGANAGKGSI